MAENAGIGMLVAEPTYKVELKGDTLVVGFGKPAQNDQIVRDAVKRMNDMVKSGEIAGGPMIKIDGPASLPVAIAIAHSVGHLYEVVAVLDPKLAKKDDKGQVIPLSKVFVVAISHGKQYQPGDLVD